ncbi:MAG: hypothetical protein ACI30I_02820 [Parabacteroides sp.]
MTQQQTSNKPLTPLEKLRADKQRTLAACQEQEAKLNADFVYIQQHAHSLLLAGITSLLFPDNKKQKGKGTASSASAAPVSIVPLNVGDYLSIVRGMVPVLWEVAQPFVVSWGIKRMKRWISGLFTRKSSGKEKN